LRTIVDSAHGPNLGGRGFSSVAPSYLGPCALLKSLPPSSRSPWCPLLAALQSLCLLGQPSSPPPTTTIDQETRELCPFADQGAAHRPRSATAGQAQLHSLLDLQGCLQFPLPRPEIVVVRDLFVKWVSNARRQHCDTHTPACTRARLPPACTSVNTRHSAARPLSRSAALADHIPGVA
jgi:hypothetical protein